MRRTQVILMGLCACLALMLIPGVTTYAQKISSKTQKVEGLLVVTSKDASTITVQTKYVRTRILFDAKTQIIFRNQPASSAELRDGRRVTCHFKSNDRNQMLATRIDLREK